MKNLLTVLATVTLTIPGSTVFINNHQSMQSLDFYWNNSHSDVEYNNSYTNIGGAGVRFTFLETINLGQLSLDNFRSVSIIDTNNASYSKTSWGNDAYWGDSLNKVNNTAISDVLVNQKMTVKNIAESNTKIPLLFTKQWSGLAYMESVHRVGLSSYYENGNNYIQIYGYQYVYVQTTWQGGGLWTNIGQGIKLIS